jgi:hypothetical protein
MPQPVDVARVIVDERLREEAQPPNWRGSRTVTQKEIVDARGDWAGHFSVVEVDRIRMRPLPSV